MKTDSFREVVGGKNLRLPPAYSAILFQKETFMRIFLQISSFKCKSPAPTVKHLEDQWKSSLQSAWSCPFFVFFVLV